MNDLLIDIGNTRLKWAIATKQSMDFIKTGAFEHRSSVQFIKEQIEALGSAFPKFNAIIVSSVIDHALITQFDDWCEQTWGIVPQRLVSSSEFAGVRNAYEEPVQLGSDRWASLLAAHHLYEGVVAVANFGTATTIDFMQADGQHLGGYILPGAQLMAKILAEQTHALPEIVLNDIEQSAQQRLPAKNTTEAIASGIQSSQVGCLELVMSEARQSIAMDVSCIVTGGGVQSILGRLSFSCHHEPDLVLKGLLLALKHNKASK